MEPAGTELGGSCHCGAVRLQFRPSRPLAGLPLRRCGCSFCRRHGARTVADPEGTLAIRAEPGALRRYRFGLATADFLLCARCGVYIAAAISSGGRSFAPLNANTLDVRESLDPAPPLVDYEAESSAERVARRLARWTPVTVTEAAGPDA